MSGSILGKNFQISTWGESHGSALGVVIDGCPAGLNLSEEDIQSDLDLRKPGSNKFGTQRKESDTVHILSGVFEGKTTGTPISLIVYNENHKSSDYSNIKDVLYEARLGFPFYYVYIKSTDITKVDSDFLSKLRQEIGVEIGNEIIKSVELCIDFDATKKRARKK